MNWGDAEDDEETLLELSSTLIDDVLDAAELELAAYRAQQAAAQSLDGPDEPGASISGKPRPFDGNNCSQNTGR